MSIAPSTPLLLGSASPRRREILEQLRIPHRVLAAEVDETPYPEEAPVAYLERIVSAKRVGVEHALAASSAGASDHAGILVADTLVVLEGQGLGKPRDRDEASSHLSRLVGRTHQVMTRFLVSGVDGAERALTVETSVSMRSATLAELQGYVDSGEPDDKAGGYAIQGLGAFLVEGIAGSYTNVVGLPASELVRELVGMGLLDQFPLPDSQVFL